MSHFVEYSCKQTGIKITFSTLCFKLQENTPFKTQETETFNIAKLTRLRSDISHENESSFSLQCLRF